MFWIFGKGSEAALGLLWMSSLPEGIQEGVQEGIPSPARWNPGSCRLCLVELLIHAHILMPVKSPSRFIPGKNDPAVQNPSGWQGNSISAGLRIPISMSPFLLFSTLSRGLCCFCGERSLVLCWRMAAGVSLAAVISAWQMCELFYFTCLCAACAAYK